MARCGRCGEDNPERANFCLACGSELPGEGTQARKTVTILFVDVVDSTRLGERLDPEVMGQVMGRYYECARSAIEAHGGVVDKFIGDAVMALFGIPRAHEDDALRAVRAAVQIQKDITRMNEEDTGSDPLSVRVGINSGEVLAASGADGRTGVVGDAVNAAARLEKLAQPNGIVIGDATYRLVRGSISAEPLGPVELRGKQEPVDAHVVLAVDPPSSLAPTSDVAMVGRVREMEALVRAYERVADDRICLLFTLLGQAGIGKSRLITEVIENALVAPRVLSGRCLPYGDGITYWPITEVISTAAHISDRDSQEDAAAKLAALVEGIDDAKTITNLVGQLIGFSEQTASQEETFWAVRKLFEALASQSPLVVVIDDIHWAEDTLLDLIDHIVDWCSEAPILIACLARPELLETRPTWAGGKLNATTILLEPLREAESKELFTRLLGDAGVIEALLPRILDVSGGNPFFLEETVAMLIDEGMIEQVDGRWVAHADVEQIAIPPTINALLTARLDQLPQTERVTIELAALMGKVFASQAVKDLSGDERTADALENLSKKGMLRLDQEEFAGEEMYRFRHILIRDAAYQVIPKERRAELHERYADWLLDVLGERASEYEEIVAYHYDRAYAYQEELRAEGSVDTRAKAANHLASAGRRAFTRGDCPAAISLLDRAALLSEPSGDDLPIRIELAEAMIEMGQYDEAKQELAHTILRADDLGDKAMQIFADIHMKNLVAETQPNVSMEGLQGSLLEAIGEMERLDYALGAAHAYRMLSYALDTQGQSSKGLEALEKAISFAEKAGDERRVKSYQRNLIGSLSWSPMPLPELERETTTFLERARRGSDLRGEARALCILGMTRALQGDVDTGRQFIQDQRAIHEKLDMHVAKAWACFESTWVEIAAEDYERAESQLREALGTLDDRGERAVLPTVLVLLADVLCTRGNLEEAQQLIDRARAMAGKDDVLTQVKWRSALARVQSRRDPGPEAVDLARAAVELADTTEYIDWRGVAWMDLAETLRLVKLPGAEEAAQRAAELFRHKGMTVLESRALSF